MAQAAEAGAPSSVRVDGRRAGRLARLAELRTLLADRQGVSVGDVAAQLGVSDNTARELLVALGAVATTVTTGRIGGQRKLWSLPDAEVAP
jgi:predicted ArsR family transcriptional regulator